MTHIVQLGALLLAAVMLSGCPQEPPVVRPHSVTMHWDAVPTPQYEVYRGDTPDALTPNVTTTAPDYVDRTVAAGRTYYYAVTSQNVIDTDAGPIVLESDKSNVIVATVPQ